MQQMIERGRQRAGVPAERAAHEAELMALKKSPMRYSLASAASLVLGLLLASVVSQSGHAQQRPATPAAAQPHSAPAPSPHPVSPAPAPQTHSVAPAAQPQRNRPQHLPQQEEQQAPHSAPARPPPQTRPPEEHAHGATERQRPRQAYPPEVVVHGRTRWAHRDYHAIVRPNYQWNWAQVRSVTCSAADAGGDQYPVSEVTGPGFAPGNLSDVEDDALDRCYSEAGQDAGCTLVDCIGN